MAVDWGYFNKFQELINLYMPTQGEGDTMASQAVTAINKLIYKWYNDGDVFDNTYRMQGWCNDLSSYANWLCKYLGWTVASILEVITEEWCDNDDTYEDLLKDLADTVLDQRYLSWLNQWNKVGSIYKCNGRYKFTENYDEEDEDEY